MHSIGHQPQYWYGKTAKSKMVFNWNVILMFNFVAQISVKLNCLLAKFCVGLGLVHLPHCIFI